MTISFEQLTELITYAIIGLGFVLLYRSVPSGFVDEFRKIAGNAADKTATPLDNTLLQILDALRVLAASNSAIVAQGEKHYSEDAPATEERPRD